MPWRVKRAGPNLQVDIGMPIDDWEGVLDGIWEELPQGPAVVVIASETSGCSTTDAALLHTLCETLVQEGITVRSVST
jgi:hypothetical protein